MKKILLGVAAVVGLLVVVLMGLIIATFLGRKPLQDGFELPGGAITIKDGFTSAYLLPAGEHSAALIDAGNDAAGSAILAALAAHHYTPDDVRMVLLTHGHPDHTAATALFKNAEVVALADEAPLVEGLVGGRSPVAFLFPVRPTGIHVTHPAHDGETVRVGDVSIEIFAVPGHTAGSAAYFAGGTLFLGDSADATRDEALRSAPPLFSESSEQNIAALKTLAQRLTPSEAAVKALAFAHSGALQGLGPLVRFAAGPS